MDIAKITEAYRAKTLRLEELLRLYTELPPAERHDVVARLILLLEEAPKSNGHPPEGDKPKLLDVVRRALADAGRPMSAPEIYAYARTLRSDIRKNSIETTVSKAAQRGLLKKIGMSETGLKLYAQP
jgi:hypothetical protein